MVEVLVFPPLRNANASRVFSGSMFIACGEFFELDFEASVVALLNFPLLKSSRVIEMSNGLSISEGGGLSGAKSSLQASVSGPIFDGEFWLSMGFTFG